MRDRISHVGFKVFQRFGRVYTTDKPSLLAMNGLIGLREQVEFATALEYTVPAALAEFRSRTCMLLFSPRGLSLIPSPRATYRRFS